MHPPNVDGAIWLAKSIFPKVAARVPDARLQLVGCDGISVHGSVPDVVPYSDAAVVVVAPIRIGGSMRGKVLEALAAGKAVVATPRAAEGVDAVDGEHLVVADGEDAFVEALVALLLDPPRRRTLARTRGAGRRAIWAGTTGRVRLRRPRATHALATGVRPLTVPHLRRARSHRSAASTYVRPVLRSATGSRPSGRG